VSNPFLGHVVLLSLAALFGNFSIPVRQLMIFTGDEDDDYNYFYSSLPVRQLMIFTGDEDDDYNYFYSSCSV